MCYPTADQRGMGCTGARSLRGSAAQPVLGRAFLVAQVPSKHPLIGYLGMASAEAGARAIRALLQGLHELGYQEGQNFDIAYRFADGDETKLPSLTEDLLRLKPDVIYAIYATPVKLATNTIPIVSPALNNPSDSASLRAMPAQAAT